MERPAQLTFRQRRFSSRSIAAMSGALVLEAATIYAVATGLAFTGIHFLPQSLDVEFLESNPPPPRPVVLPRLELVQPPPVTVIQPEVVIETPRPPPRLTVARVRRRQVVSFPVRIARAPAPPVPSRVPGITAPVSIGASHSCERAYPLTAVRLEQQGTTIVRFTVLTDGSVADVRVAKSSGHEMLDDAAVHCASAWRYRPALEDGRPVTAPWSTNVQWKLRYGYRPM